ncbi:hypothetical protein QYF36_001403 [Acer negundo]|nr:hypothetical protein QYF36_001403 [Acer negundo]
MGMKAHIEDASIPPYGYTSTDGTSVFHQTPQFIEFQQTPTLEENTPEIATKHILQYTHGKPFRLEECWAIVKNTVKWYHYVEVVKGRQHKGDTNNYPFDLNSENSSADKCMRSSHGRPSSSSVNHSDDGSLFSQYEGLERPPGRKTSTARKHKAKPYNINLLSEDILEYEARSNELYEHNVALKAAVEERKRNFVRDNMEVTSEENMLLNLWLRTVSPPTRFPFRNDRSVRQWGRTLDGGANNRRPGNWWKGKGPAEEEARAGKRWMSNFPSD